MVFSRRRERHATKLSTYKLSNVVEISDGDLVHDKNVDCYLDSLLSVCTDNKFMVSTKNNGYTLNLDVIFPVNGPNAGSLRTESRLPWKIGHHFPSEWATSPQPPHGIKPPVNIEYHSPSKWAASPQPAHRIKPHGTDPRIPPIPRITRKWSKPGRSGPGFYTRRGQR